jgi:hypothetical protein
MLELHMLIPVTWPSMYREMGIMGKNVFQGDADVAGTQRQNL